MAKKVVSTAGKPALLVPKKRNPQDATRKRDVAPVRHRVASLEVRLSALELWAQTLFNPDSSPKSFERRKVAR